MGNNNKLLRQLIGDLPVNCGVISHEEDRIQKACILWFKYQHPDKSMLLFHVNNEAYMGHGRTKEQREYAGHRAKEMGVVAGVSDLLFLYPGAHGEHGLCIEMKTEKGRQSENQKAWQKAVESVGYAYRLCRSLEDFKTIINQYLSL